MSPESPASGHLELAAELALSHSIAAAGRAGLLGLLAGPLAPVPDPASALGLHPEATARVLEVLAAGGWVEARPEGWSAAAWVRAGAAVLPGTLSPDAAFSHIDTFLADGSVVPRHQASTVRHDQKVVADLGHMFEGVASRLAAELSPVRGTIVDIGAGSAVWSLAQLAVSDDARVVAVDRAEVLRAARARAERLGLSHRLELLPGEFHAVALPPARRVVLANVLHLLSPDDCGRLVAWAAAALEPGGELVLIDVDAAHTPRARRSLAGYALHLRLREPHGRVHPVADLCRWLTQAGLHTPHTHPMDAGRLGLVAVVGVRSSLPHAR